MNKDNAYKYIVNIFNNLENKNKYIAIKEIIKIYIYGKIKAIIKLLIKKMKKWKYMQ